MIQDVKHGTHKIGTYMDITFKTVAFLEENHQKVGVERCMTTRRAQIRGGTTRSRVAHFC